MSVKQILKFAGLGVVSPLGCVSIVFLLFACSTVDVQAQGRLRGVSKSVRKNSQESKPAESTAESGRCTAAKERSTESSSEVKPQNRHDAIRRSVGRGEHHDFRGTRDWKSTSRLRHDGRACEPRYSPRCRPATFHVAACMTHVPPVLFEPVFGPAKPAVESVLIEQPLWGTTPPTILGDTWGPAAAELVAEPVAFDAAVGKDWFPVKASALWATLGSSFDGITTGGMGARLQASGGPGLEATVMMLRESDGGYRDHLYIGDVNLIYEILNRPNVRGRIGLGVNWLNDAWGPEAGFNLTGGFDLRITRHLMLALEGDFGNLGDADFAHLRAAFVRRFESVELMLGVDCFNIGGAEVNSVFTGVQFRF
ncbi:MAG: hypothetical protein P8J27_04915 [Mariniblastus sp.]|nr:hypothetical protein [Mariniblastus sp.]